jgi:AraC-like DNA-binding protein
MPKRPDIGIDAGTFRALAAEYRQRWRIGLYAIKPDGEIVLGQAGASCRRSAACRQVRRLALEEALRWGEPTIEFCPDRQMLWAVPLMHNAKVAGGLVAGAAEREVFPEGSGTATLDVRGACADLRRLAEQANLTNAALLAGRREEYSRERERAEAIHELKLRGRFDFRQLYLRDEPDLIAAIRADDRGRAREVLNHVLMAIHRYAGERLDVVKSFFMSLVATMCCTAVESGGNVEDLLGANLAGIAELCGFESMEQVAPWLHNMLDRILECLHRQRGWTNGVMVTTALSYMAEHFAEDISRDEVAHVAHLSPSHFSRLLKRQTGRSFTDLITQFRVQRAGELLRHGDKPLALVALEAGFRDQSYFTKVFRRQTGSTPKQFREKGAE